MAFPLTTITCKIHPTHVVLGCFRNSKCPHRCHTAFATQLGPRIQLLYVRCSDFPCYKAYSSSPGALRAAIHTSCQSLSPALSPCTSTPRVQLTTFASQPSSDLQAQQLCEQHSVAATKASAAFAKTKNLFKEDMAYALEYAQPASPRIAAQRDSMSSRASSHSAVSVRSKATANHQAPNGSSSVSRASSTRSANSVADSVSSYHGYTGVNYHAGKHSHASTLVLPS